MSQNCVKLCVAAADHQRYSESAYSQDGAKFPTGGKSTRLKAHECFECELEGQQIRCSSGADGQSPDGRE